MRDHGEPSSRISGDSFWSSAIISISMSLGFSVKTAAAIFRAVFMILATSGCPCVNMMIENTREAEMNISGLNVFSLLLR